MQSKHLIKHSLPPSRMRKCFTNSFTNGNRGQDTIRRHNVVMIDDDNSRKYNVGAEGSTHDINHLRLLLDVDASDKLGLVALQLEMESNRRSLESRYREARLQTHQDDQKTCSKVDSKKVTSADIRYWRRSCE